MNFELAVRRLNELLAKERFLHTLRVRKTAIELAYIHRVSKNKASVAGLLHDCGKLSVYKMRNLIKKYGLRLDNVEKKIPALWHPIISSEIAKREFNVKDKAILSAIKNHTTGVPNMNKLDMIIYMADLIEDGRDEFCGLDKIRRWARISIFKAFKEALKLKIKYVLDTNRVLHPNSILCWNWLINRKKVPR